MSDEKNAIEEEVEKAIAETVKASVHSGVCPSCGYCPCCGRRLGWYPSPAPVPFYPSYPYYSNTCGSLPDRTIS